jgi:hypothetical protein
MKKVEIMKRVSRKILAIGIVCLMMMLPFIGMAQDPGNNPDGPPPASPPSVPFDDNMNIGLIAVGIIFCIVILKKSFKTATIKS